MRCPWKDQYLKNSLWLPCGEWMIPAVEAGDLSKELAFAQVGSEGALACGRGGGEQWSDL